MFKDIFNIFGKKDKTKETTKPSITYKKPDNIAKKRKKRTVKEKTEMFDDMLSDDGATNKTYDGSLTALLDKLKNQK